MDPPAAQQNVIEVAGSLGLNVSVAVAYEGSVKESGNCSLLFLEVYKSKLNILYWYSYQVLITIVVFDTLLFIVDSVLGSYEVHFFLALMSVENNDDIPSCILGEKFSSFSQLIIDIV